MLTARKTDEELLEIAKSIWLLPSAETTPELAEDFNRVMLELKRRGY